MNKLKFKAITKAAVALFSIGITIAVGKEAINHVRDLNDKIFGNG